MTKRLLIICLGALTAIILLASPAFAVDLKDGAQIFIANCSGCHANGGNVVRRGKTLKLKDLQRNGYATVDAIAQIVTNGKGNMSAYRNRLNNAQIENVSHYVLDRAKKGWK